MTIAQEDARPTLKTPEQKQNINSTQTRLKQVAGQTSHLQLVKVHDFAHIPWEDTPNFPKPPQRKKFRNINCERETSGGPSSRRPCG